jgi:uncharacterized protein (DUF1800 family)
MLVACGGGGSEEAPSQDTSSNVVTNTPVQSQPSTESDESNTSDDLIFDDAATAARFLNQATFGATAEDIQSLTNESASDWLLEQFSLPASYHEPMLEDTLAKGEFLANHATTISFWTHAISADDQLRQRVAFALSEIMVLSNFGGNVLFDAPEPITYHQDLLTQHAFGNYADLLKEVTYSPGMGWYLTYLGNQKADPETGRMPDENYAREILQLFSIGLLALNLNSDNKCNAHG